MRKIILLTYLVIFSHYLFAQFKIFEDRRIGINLTTTPHSQSPHVDIRTIYASTGLYVKDNPLIYSGGDLVKFDVNSRNNYPLCANYVNNSGRLFHVKGDGSVYVLGTIAQGSDIKLKKEIKHIESPLNKILNLNGITYLRNSKK